MTFYPKNLDHIFHIGDNAGPHDPESSALTKHRLLPQSRDEAQWCVLSPSIHDSLENNTVKHRGGRAMRASKTGYFHGVDASYLSGSNTTQSQIRGLPEVDANKIRTTRQKARDVR